MSKWSSMKSAHPQTLHGTLRTVSPPLGNSSSHQEDKDVKRAAMNPGTLTYCL